MLSPRLTNCVDGSSIIKLIENIDCKMAELATNLYYNTVYMLNQPIDQTTMLDLLNYRRILTFKYCNINYATNSNPSLSKPITLEDIADRVKLLTLNCKREECTSTTTTTCPPTTTTTTTQVLNCALLGTVIIQ
jgi:hypothetical protein